MNVWTGTPRLDGVRVLLVEGAPEVREVVADVLGQFRSDTLAAWPSVPYLDEHPFLKYLLYRCVAGIHGVHLIFLAEC